MFVLFQIVHLFIRQCQSLKGCSFHCGETKQNILKTEMKQIWSTTYEAMRPVCPLLVKLSMLVTYWGEPKVHSTGTVMFWLALISRLRYSMVREQTSSANEIFHLIR